MAMSLAAKQPDAKAGKQPPMRRIWRAPTSKARWFWLAICLLFYAVLFGWYLYTVRTQRFPGPFNDPLRLFGIIAFLLVLSTAAYSLRRRFMRSLPGKVQDWLWMHTWVGVTALLVAMLHENFAYITHEYDLIFANIADAYWGGGALLALIILVVSGLVGRIVDITQTRLIAREANNNGVGIVRAVEERIIELEYTIERLCAGKSETFKAYCIQAINGGIPGRHFPTIAPNEQLDFKRAYETLVLRERLERSRDKQQQARSVMHTWRNIHITIAVISLLVISYHSVMQLLTNVFAVLR